MTTIALRLSPLRRPSVRILALLIVALVALALFEWHSARRVPGAAAQSDTMCVASRIGLPCRQ